MPHKRKCGIHSRGSYQPHSRWACAALSSFIAPNLFTSHTFVARFWRNFTLLNNILPFFCSDFVNSDVPVQIFTNKPIFGPKDWIASLNSFLFALIWKWQRSFEIMLHLKSALIGQPQLSAPDWRLVIGWKPRAPDLLQTSGCAPVCPMDERGGINLRSKARQGRAGQCGISGVKKWDPSPLQPRWKRGPKPGIILHRNTAYWGSMAKGRKALQEHNDVLVCKANVTNLMLGGSSIYRMTIMILRQIYSNSYKLPSMPFTINLVILFPMARAKVPIFIFTKLLNIAMIRRKPGGLWAQWEGGQGGG